MIHQPSLKPKAETTLIYSRDPALNLPEDPDARAKALEVARDTGKWSELLGPGAQPTYFHIRIPTGATWNYLAGEIMRQRMLDSEAAAFALRVALIKVDNFGDHKVDRVVDQVHGETMAGKAIINAIYTEAGEYGRDIVEELGTYVLERGKNPISPK
jgi:hypothetical protein